MLLFSGSANRPLAEKLADALQIKLGSATINHFPDGECNITIHDNIRNQEVFIIQSTCAPVNHNIMELCLLIAAIRRAGAKYIHLIAPYFGYARQASSLHTVAAILCTAGIDRLITVDLHEPSYKKFFNCQVENLSAADIFLSDIKNKNLNSPIIVSPDVGGVNRAYYLSKLLNNSAVTFIAKKRQSNKVTALNIIGSVTNRDCIIIDDIIDTAQTLQTTASMLKTYGARNIYAYCTHGVLSANAIPRVTDSVCAEVVITDSIDINGIGCYKLRKVSLVNLFTKRIFNLI